MMRLFLYFIYIITIVGLLPINVYSQGIRTDSESYNNSDSIGGLNSEQTEYYSQEENSLLNKLVIPNKIERVEHYVDKSSIIINDSGTIITLETREETLGKKDYMPQENKKTSIEFADEYEKSLKDKTKMVYRHQKEIKKQGESKALRKKQLKELIALTKTSNELRKMERNRHKEERLEEEQKEKLKLEQANLAHIDNYGTPMPESMKYKVTYDRVKSDIKALKARQLIEKKKSLSSFDRNQKHIVEKGRMDRELKKARKNLDEARRKEIIEKRKRAKAKLGVQ